MNMNIAYHGWKCDLPYKFWPVTLDNFFDNPDEIRELGLSMLKSKKVDGGGSWPGYRSEELSKMNEGLAQRITEKILSCYFNLNFEAVYWKQNDMQFNSIPSIDKDKNSIKNKGWIHRDGRIDPRYSHNPDIQDDPVELAGLIYLTEDIEGDTGTSLFDMKTDQTLVDYHETITARFPLYKGEPISEEEIRKNWKIHRSCFTEKVRFENIYNRLIMYDTREWHAANNYYTPNDDRLTITFFISGIRAKNWPLERVRQIKC